MPGANGDWPYKLEQWDVSKLYVDKAYQRPLTTLAARIAANYDARLLTPIIVSVRKAGGNGAIVDGQTRVAAMKRMGKTHIPALVFKGTRAQEAGLFARFQSERRGIRPYHRHRAAVVAGNPAALEVQEITRRHGYDIIDLGATVKPWGISAVKALEELHDWGQLDPVLAITSKAWPPRLGDQSPYGKGHPLNNEVLRGLAVLLRGKDEIDPERMAHALATSNPQELSIRASHLRQGRGLGGGSATYMRQVLSDLYRRKGKP